MVARTQMSESCLIIAEAGVNHNGSLDKALRLVDAAVNAGADIIKFQTFKAEKLVTRTAQKATYQKIQTGDGDQYGMLKELELSKDSHIKLSEYCKERSIEFLSTAFDEESAAFLIELGCKRIKIPSGELTNTPLLRFLAAQGLKIILSTGMADLKEVGEAVSVIAKVREEQGFSEPLEEILTLLHCTSNYPTPLEDVNLRAMRTLEEQFSLTVGYSDHTAGLTVAPLAIAMGAVVYEKHFTLDRSLPGPDHAASLEPDELHSLVQVIRDTERTLGSGHKAPTKSELEVRVAARRSVTVVRRMNTGEVLHTEDLGLMRPGDGIPPAALEKIVGRRLKRAMQSGETLHWEDLV